jgi:hypothetical protein
LNAYTRTRLALTEDVPTIKPYDQDAWALLPDYTLPIEVSLRIIEGLHLRWEAMWRNLPGSAFERTFFHPDNGMTSLDDALQSYANHGDNHMKQITDLCTSRGW